MSHPRDRVITVFGRKPVLEAVSDGAMAVERIFVADSARGGVVQEILRAARQRGLEVQRVTERQVNRISRNARQDQGVAADVRARRMGAIGDQLAQIGPRAAALVLDGVTTPANVGMILRSATAAGLNGIVLPRRGSPEVGPLVIKASAGVAFQAPIWRCETVEEGVAALKAAGFRLYGLAADGALDLFEAPFPDRVAFVLGNETHGVSPPIARLLDGAVRIPMAPGVESLNVATAGTLVGFELLRRARAAGAL